MEDQQSIQQRTIKDTAHFVGMTLNAQRKTVVNIHPTESDTGLFFVRKDINPGMNTIPARWYNVIPPNPTTTLTNQHGITISHVEFILAALRGCGIDNARIEVDGPEVPIMDGSAKPFVDVIEHIGSVAQDEPKHVYWVQNAIEYRHLDQYAVLSPDKDSRFTVHLCDYDSNIDTQVFSFKSRTDEFQQGIAPARLFTTPRELDEFASANGIHDALPNNILILPGADQITQRPLRFENEYMRHVALEAYGFLSLMSHEFIGHLYLKNPTIRFLQKFLRHFFNSRTNWAYLDYNAYRTIVLSEKKYSQNKHRFRHGDTI